MKLIIQSCLVVAMLGLILYLSRPDTPVYIPPAPERSTLQLEIAGTDATRATGLSKYDRLADGTGMLFVFDRSEIQCMWNAGVKFDVGVVFMDENYQYLNAYVMPAGSNQKACSSTPAKYAIESDPKYFRAP